MPDLVSLFQFQFAYLLYKQGPVILLTEVEIKAERIGAMPATLKKYFPGLLTALILVFLLVTACQNLTIPKPASAGTRVPLSQKAAVPKTSQLGTLSYSQDTSPLAAPNTLPQPVAIPTARPALPQVVALEVDKPRVVIGQEIEVRLEVRNAGEVKGEFSFPLILDMREVAILSTELEGGQAKILSTHLKMTESGFKRLSVSSHKLLVEILEPASFSLGKLSLSKAKVVVGEETMATMAVKNNGQVPGEYTDRFIVEGQDLCPAMATILQGETITFNCRVFRSTPGNHRVAFANQQVELRVLRAASFVVGQLVLSKPKVAIGEKTTASIDVTNAGELAGEYKSTFKIEGENSVPVAAIIQPGEKKIFEYTISKSSTGLYRVLFAECQTELRVFRPASFVVDKLQLSKSRVAVGENIVAFIDVTNIGEITGDYSDAAELEWQDSFPLKNTIHPGETKRFSFTFSRNAPGNSRVRLGTAQVDLSVVNELAISTQSRYLNADPHDIVSAPIFWDDKSIVISGVVNSARYFFGRKETRIDFSADIPNSLYEPVAFSVRIPGRIDWLLTNSRVKIFGKVAGLEKISIVVNSVAQDVPIIMADYVLMGDRTDHKGSTILNPIGLREYLQITHHDGRTIGVQLGVSSRGESAWPLMRKLGISDGFISIGKVPYVISARVANTSRATDKTIRPSDYSFALVSLDGVVLSEARAFMPNAILEKELYPGEIGDWWVVLQGPPEVENPVLHLTFGEGREGWMELFPR